MYVNRVLQWLTSSDEIPYKPGHAEIPTFTWTLLSSQGLAAVFGSHSTGGQLMADGRRIAVAA